MSDKAPTGERDEARRLAVHDASEVGAAAALSGDAPLFQYDGRIYVRPIGRGICYGGEDGLRFALEDAVGEGYYEATVIIRRLS